MRKNRWIQKIKQTYQQKNICYQISFLFTSSGILVILSIVFLLYGIFCFQYHARVEKEMQNRMDQMEWSMNAYLRHLMNVANVLYDVAIKEKDFYQMSNKEKLIQQMRLLYEMDREEIQDMAVFYHTGELLAAVPQATVRQGIDLKEKSWFQQALYEPQNFHDAFKEVQHLFCYKNSAQWVIPFSHGLELTDRKKTEQGVLLIDLKFRGIQQIFRKINQSKEGYFYLVDRQGEILYHPRQQLLHAGVLKENNQKESLHGDGSYSEKFGKSRRMVTVKTVGYTGWKIIGITYMRTAHINYLQTIMFIILLLSFFLFLLSQMNVLLSKKISLPIQELEKSVKELETGRLDTCIPIAGAYEIRHLGQSMKQMAAQLKQLMQTIIVEQELKRKRELDVLQSQIQPHFLYNTLDAVVWLAENNQIAEATKMVTALARFFRLSLNRGENDISVALELEQVKNYLEIQKIRFKDQFTYKITIEETVSKWMMIKLLVQPLVENAIYHGMACMDGDGEIQISAYEKSGELWIRVQDNGLGMPQKKVEQILTKGYQNDTKLGKGSGVGLRNVQERIQLYFGREYGLLIQSEPDEGTCVTIHLPKNINGIKQEKQE